MIKAIFFDFGGVFIDSPFVVISEVAADMGIDDALLQSITFGDYDIDSDHPWHKLERGEIGLEDARQAILLEGEKYGLKTDIYDMFVRFATIDKGIRGPLVEKLNEWKLQGLTLGLITNNLKEFNSWKTAFPFVLDTVFTVLADSSQLGMRKPDPEIYAYALRQAGVEPSEALFVDDHPSNVAAAIALGMQAFVVKGNIQHTINWIDEQLK